MSEEKQYLVCSECDEQIPFEEDDKDAKCKKCGAEFDLEFEEEYEEVGDADDDEPYTNNDEEKLEEEDNGDNYDEAPKRRSKKGAKKSRISGQHSEPKKQKSKATSKRQKRKSKNRIRQNVEITKPVKRQRLQDKRNVAIYNDQEVMDNMLDFVLDQKKAVTTNDLAIRLNCNSSMARHVMRELLIYAEDSKYKVKVKSAGGKNIKCYEFRE